MDSIVCAGRNSRHIKREYVGRLRGRRNRI